MYIRLTIAILFIILSASNNTILNLYNYGLWTNDLWPYIIILLIKTSDGL